MHTRSTPHGRPSTLGDWPELVRRLDQTGTPLRWSADPRLAGMCSVEQLRAWTAPGDPSRADEVLGALVHLAAGDGDENALLVLLHLLLPGISRIAKRFRHLSSDPFGLVLGELTVQVRRFPLDRRTRAFAANLLMTTQQEVWRELKRYRLYNSVPPELLIDPIADRGNGGLLGTLDEVVPGPGEADDIDLVDLLMWARRIGAVDPEDLSVLLEVEHAREQPGARAAVTNVAQRRGCTVRTIQRRRARALKQLRAHRDDYLAAAA